MEYVEIKEDDENALMYSIHNVVTLMSNTGKIDQYSIGKTKTALQDLVMDVINNPEKYSAKKHSEPSKTKTK